MTKIKKPAEFLADVNVLIKTGVGIEVVVCFMPDPDIIIGERKSKALLALDASSSMKEMYGHSGSVFMKKPNYVQSVARKLGEILSSVTRSGKVNALYWAVSAEGNQIENIGAYDLDEWKNVVIKGPKNDVWGKGTRLLEVVKYVVDTVSVDSDWCMGVVITDGRIDDEKDVLTYCLKIGKEISEGNRKPIKLVLIGIGEAVDSVQLERFDNMFEGSGINYDLWSHGLVNNMENEQDILAVLYGELMSEEFIVAPQAVIEDDKGNVVKMFNDGLPGKIRFDLAAGTTEFVIRINGNQEIRQDISEFYQSP